ncbi:hypothetical protein CBR_g315 [Chara braunii]|uniref:Uncharacterized protein n=1 Tax=Chara braunii TaxID=69332 RepID=A0A388JQB7_CHABU|nr:hypothetical protein CBR_g315 [Chara braunii]|eukprot:GBG59985.1 hypothetical protein CBR_g315 [Chara braunii]
MTDFFNEAKMKKDEKEQRKREKKEAEEHEAAGCEQAERKAKKKAEKCKEEMELEAQRREEMRKDNDIQLAIRLSEMEENFSHQVESVIGPLREIIRHGKKKVTYVAESASASEEESDTNVTQEQSAQAEHLCISEKRNRGQEPEFDDSPPMELPPKRTPRKGALKPTKLTGRMTRARTIVKAHGSVKRISPVKTPLSARRKKNMAPSTPGPATTPTTKGALQRLRFRDGMMDVIELQRICKEEGVSYDSKIDAIFAAESRAKEKYDLDSTGITEVIAVDDSASGGPPEEQRDA